MRYKRLSALVMILVLGIGLFPFSVYSATYSFVLGDFSGSQNKSVNLPYQQVTRVGITRNTAGGNAMVVSEGNYIAYTARYYDGTTLRATITGRMYYQGGQIVYETDKSHDFSDPVAITRVDVVTDTLYSANKLSLNGTVVYTVPAPNAPSGLSANPGIESITVNWVANSESNLRGYNVYLDGVKRTSSPITSRTYTMSGLTSGRSYTIGVSAVDTNNSEGARATVAAVPLYRLLAPPDGLQAIGGKQQISLTWTHIVDSALSGYYVYNAAGTRISSLIGEPKYTVVGLDEDTQYRYAVSAVNRNGVETPLSPYVSARTSPAVDDVPPSPPSGLAVANGNAYAQLSWLVNREPDLSHYTVYLDGVMIADNVKATTYIITGLTNDQTYSVYLTATDLSGNVSGHSATLTVRPSIKTMPIVPIGYRLADVPTFVNFWFKDLWPIVAFVVGLIMSFWVAVHAKSLFGGGRA